jgi:ribosomal RNA assembly protein
MKDVVRLPRDRIGVMNEAVRRRLKKELNVECTVKGNAAELEGEGIELLTARNVAEAIGRGFSPVRAYRLLDEDTELEVMDLDRFSKARIGVIRSRIIGTNGKTRARIEECSGASVSVYGKTVAVIGSFEQIKCACEAIDMLINGSMHKTVYRFLEQSRK